MKDFFGIELEIGDRVAVTPKNYRGLVMATVIAFTPQKVRVKYGKGYSEVEYLTDPTSIIKRIKKNES